MRCAAAQTKPQGAEFGVLKLTANAVQTRPNDAINREVTQPPSARRTYARRAEAEEVMHGTKKIHATVSGLG